MDPTTRRRALSGLVVFLMTTASAPLMALAQTSAARRCDRPSDEAAGTVRFCVDSERPAQPRDIQYIWVSVFRERSYEQDLAEEDLRERAREMKPPDWDRMCWALRSGPDIPPEIASSPQPGLAEMAGCYQGALRSIWDQTIGFAGNVCSWVASRLYDPSAIASDVAAAWDLFNDVVASFYAAFYQSDALATMVTQSCARAASSLMSGSPVERARANAAFCGAVTDVVGAMAGNFANAARAGAGAITRVEVRNAVARRAIVRASNLSMNAGVVRARAVFSDVGTRSRIYLVERGGQEFLVKVPRAGQSLEEQARRFLPPEFGGYPGCSLGLVDLDLTDVGGRPGEITRGVLMRRIDGVPLSHRDAPSVFRHSHRESFEDALAQLNRAGVRIDDPVGANVILGHDGRTYFIDQAPIAIGMDIHSNRIERLMLEFDMVETRADWLRAP